MNNNLLILGAGQYSFIVKETAQAMGCFGKIDFLDDNSPLAIGKFSELAHFQEHYTFAFAAIGNPEMRLDLIQKAECLGFQIPVLVHPSATVMPSAQLSKGTIVEAQAVINSNAFVGTGCIISAGAVVNHNCQLGEVCHVDCNATVPARSVVPSETKIPCGLVYSEKKTEVISCISDSEKG